MFTCSLGNSLGLGFVLVYFSGTVITSISKAPWGGKDLLHQYFVVHYQRRSGQELKAGTAAETMEKCCSLACFPWLPQLASSYSSPLGSIISIVFHWVSTSFLFLCKVLRGNPGWHPLASIVKDPSCSQHCTIISASFYPTTAMAIPS